MESEVLESVQEPLRIDPKISPSIREEIEEDYVEHSGFTEIHKGT